MKFARGFNFFSLSTIVSKAVDFPTDLLALKLKSWQ